MNTASECLIRCNHCFMSNSWPGYTHWLLMQMMNCFQIVRVNLFDYSSLISLASHKVHYRLHCAHCLFVHLFSPWERILGLRTISHLVTSVVFVNLGASCQFLPVPWGPFCVWAHYVCNVCPHLTNPLWLASVYAPVQLSHFTLPLLHYHLE